MDVFNLLKFKQTEKRRFLLEKWKLMEERYAKEVKFRPIWKLQDMDDQIEN
jgi:hypothetical protein